MSNGDVRNDLHNLFNPINRLYKYDYSSLYPNKEDFIMRVTEVTKRDQVVDNMQKSSGKLQDIQMKMASGRRLNKTSDDPLGAARSQDIVKTISSQKQILKNINGNIAWLQRTENEINSINEILGQIRTLAIAQSGSDSNEESRLMVDWYAFFSERDITDFAKKFFENKKTKMNTNTIDVKC